MKLPAFLLGFFLLLGALNAAVMYGLFAFKDENKSAKSAVSPNLTLEKGSDF